MSTPTKELADVPGTLPLISGTNADMLDGAHLRDKGNINGVTRSWSHGVYSNLDEYYGNGNVVVFDPAPISESSTLQGVNHSQNTTLLSLGERADRNTQLIFHYNADIIRYRRKLDQWQTWKTIAFTDSAVAGLVPKQLTNEDLNDIKDINFTVYQAPYNNTVKNKPAGVNGFALRVQRISGDSFLQTLIFCETTPKVFMRSFIPSSGWCAWRQLALV